MIQYDPILRRLTYIPEYRDFSWTGTHTFSVQDVHNAGISLGTSGVTVSAVADGSQPFDWVYSVMRNSSQTLGTIRGDISGEADNRDNAPTYLSFNSLGEWVFGYGSQYSPLQPVAGNKLGFIALTGNHPTWASSVTNRGILGYVNHSETSITPTFVGGLTGVAFLGSSCTIPSYAIAVNGMYALAGSSLDSASLSAKYMGAYVGGVTYSGVGYNQFNLDTQSNYYAPAGNWAHVSQFFGQMFAYNTVKGGPATPTNKPSITSTLRAPIVGCGTADQCAIYGESTALTSASINAATRAYFARIPFPANTSATNRAHLYFIPNATQTGGPTWALDGAVYFDDGTYNSKGLYQYYDSSWHRILDSFGTDVANMDSTSGGSAWTFRSDRSDAFINIYGFSFECNGTQTAGLFQWKLYGGLQLLDLEYISTLDYRLHLRNLCHLELDDGLNMVFGTSTGTIVASTSSDKMGFWGTTPVTQPTALTTALTSITHTGPSTPDYAIATPVDSGAGSAWGFSTQDEFETVMSVILNLQTRVSELQSKLQTIGITA